MIIAMVEIDIDAAKREGALGLFATHAPEVRAMPGNRFYRYYADPESVTRVTMIHEWDTRAQFDGYAASPAFADFGKVLGPLLRGKPVSRRFEAQLVETV